MRLHTNWYVIPFRIRAVKRLTPSDSNCYIPNGTDFYIGDLRETISQAAEAATGRHPGEAAPSCVPGDPPPRVSGREPRYHPDPGRRHEGCPVPSLPR